jgi:type III pantothenate kinase
MLNAVLDFGNSRLKMGIFKENVLVEIHRFAYDSIDLDFHFKVHDFKHIMISSVIAEPLQKIKWTKSSKISVLDHLTPLPIINKYKSPETLGHDRLAAAAGAYARFSDENILIIDLGTAAKYDFLQKGGVFLGGMIAPGRAMRFKALHHFTGKLPLLDITTFPDLIGSSTQDCISSGVLNGMKAEIEGIIEQYQQKADLKVILTGGDASSFESHLKYATFAAPNLVLEGLHKILEHNV